MREKTIKEQGETIANLEENNFKMQKRNIAQSRTFKEQLKCYSEALNEERAANLKRRERLYHKFILQRIVETQNEHLKEAKRCKASGRTDIDH